MCGIAGFYNIHHPFEATDLRQMTDKIAHRGPDAEGFFIDHHVGLGHRRLSIIDLSETANQPMTSQCGDWVLVFNGEVYNYTELRSTYLAHHPFRTHSDTEVVLELIAQKGIAAISLFNGMFALAAYNKRTAELVLARDHIGIKPLYYFWNEQGFAFASELKSLTANSYIKSQIEINPKAIGLYLQLGYIPHPHSIYDSIYKLPAGSILTLRADKKIDIQSYWSLEEQRDPQPNTVRHFKKELDELLNDSIQKQMIADVSFGTFLSGGIDSSIVTAIAQKHSSTPINTFSIGFKEAKHNEAHHAKAVASYIGTKHHEFTVSYNDALALTTQMSSMYDEPYADSSAIPTFMVSQLAKPHVTMVLAGDGGDELFQGYGMYQWATRLNNPWIWANRLWIKELLRLGSNRMKRAAQLFDLADSGNKQQHIFSQEQYLFSEKEAWKALKNINAFQSRLPQYNDIFSHAAENQAFFDLKYYLPDDLLVKTDRATMQNSLEMRVPLLDHRLISFALNLPYEEKVRGNVSKYLLKEVLFDYVPRALFDRPKQGFSIPLSSWLQNELSVLITQYLSPVLIEQYGLLDPQYISQLVTAFKGGQSYLYNRLWACICLQIWAKENL